MTEFDEPIYYIMKGQLDNIREVLGEIIQLFESFMTQFNRLEESQHCVYFDEEQTPLGAGHRTERSLGLRGGRV